MLFAYLDIKHQRKLIIASVFAYTRREKEDEEDGLISERRRAIKAARRITSPDKNFIVLSLTRRTNSRLWVINYDPTSSRERSAQKTFLRWMLVTVFHSLVRPLRDFCVLPLCLSVFLSPLPSISARSVFPHRCGLIESAN